MIEGQDDRMELYIVVAKFSFLRSRGKRMSAATAYMDSEITT